MRFMTSGPERASICLHPLDKIFGSPHLQSTRNAKTFWTILTPKPCWCVFVCAPNSLMCCESRIDIVAIAVICQLSKPIINSPLFGIKIPLYLILFWAKTFLNRFPSLTLCFILHTKPQIHNIKIVYRQFIRIYFIWFSFLCRLLLIKSRLGGNLCGRFTARFRPAIRANRPRWTLLHLMGIFNFIWIILFCKTKIPKHFNHHFIFPLALRAARPKRDKARGKKSREKCWN